MQRWLKPFGTPLGRLLDDDDYERAAVAVHFHESV